MEIKHYIKLDLSRSNARHTVQVSKGDKRTHKLIFSFCNGSEPVDISKAIVAGLAVRNSIGNICEATIFPEDNVVEYTLSSFDTLETGTVLCTLTLVDADGSTLYAPSFYLFVNEDYSDNTEEELSNTLEGNDAWSIIANAKEYARKVFEIADGADQRIKSLEEIDLVYNEETHTLKIKYGDNSETEGVDFSPQISKICQDIKALNKEKADKKQVSLLEKRVENLEDETLGFLEDSTVAYEKAVPVGAAKYALINEVGGMSYRVVNLIPFPYRRPNIHGETLDGVKWTCNANGSITANGTATKNRVVIIHRFSSSLYLDGTYTF